MAILKETMQSIQPKIGLEIHVYLNTKEKLFCQCKAEHGLKITAPNTNICPICTGQPGAKPMLPNSEAIKKSIQTALLLNTKINPRVAWKRKHYDWPDLPKGYQNTISGAHASPIGENGEFENIKIIETHLEEDPAAWNPATGEIDYNRSGYPLIEIVTAPEFKTSDQVSSWLKDLLLALKYAKISDKTMGIKVDVNVSVTRGERVEIKNIHSLTDIERAINYEIHRQIHEPQKHKETRAFDTNKGITISMRSKEETADYRFITDPDLPAINIEKKRIEELKKSLPNSPKEKVNKLIKKYKIPQAEAGILTQNLKLVEFFEGVIKKIPAQLAVPWTIVELLRVLNYNKKTLDEVNINPEHFIELLQLVKEKKITELKAKQILNTFIPESFSPKEKLKGQETISNEEEIEKMAQEVIKKNSKAVQDYKSGNTTAINFLIGEIMKASNRRADYKTAKIILERLLK